MSGHAMHSKKARRLTLLAQAGALICGAGAVAAIGLFSPESTEVDIEPPTPDRQGGGAPEEAQLATADFGQIAAQLERVWTPPVDETSTEQPDKPVPIKSPDQQATPVADDGVWQYLGSIMTPKRRLAVLSVDGNQRLLAEGKTHDGSELLAVHPDWIVVRADGEERRIDRAPKDKPLIGSTVAANVAAPVTGTRLTAMEARARAEALQAARDPKLTRDEAERREEELRKRLEEAERRRAAAMADREGRDVREDKN